MKRMFRGTMLTIVTLMSLAGGLVKAAEAPPSLTIGPLAATNPAIAVPYATSGSIAAQTTDAQRSELAWLIRPIIAASLRGVSVQPAVTRCPTEKGAPSGYGNILIGDIEKRNDTGRCNTIVGTINETVRQNGDNNIQLGAFSDLPTGDTNDFVNIGNVLCFSATDGKVLACPPRVWPSHNDKQYNTGIGINAIKRLTSGVYVTAVGINACGSVTTGSRDLCFGDYTDVPTPETSDFINIMNKFCFSGITGAVLPCPVAKGRSVK